MGYFLAFDRVLGLGGHKAAFVVRVGNEDLKMGPLTLAVVSLWHSSLCFPCQWKNGTCTFPLNALLIMAPRKKLNLTRI